MSRTEDMIMCFIKLDSETILNLAHVTAVSSVGNSAAGDPQYQLYLVGREDSVTIGQDAYDILVRTMMDLYVGVR